MAKARTAGFLYAEDTKSSRCILISCLSYFPPFDKTRLTKIGGFYLCFWPENADYIDYGAPSAQAVSPKCRRTLAAPPSGTHEMPLVVHAPQGGTANIVAKNICKKYSPSFCSSHCSSRPVSRLKLPEIPTTLFRTSTYRPCRAHFFPIPLRATISLMSTPTSADTSSEALRPETTEPTG